jgi:hypothetical protein
MSTGGRAPRNCLASKNLFANLRRRKKKRVPARDPPELKPSKELEMMDSFTVGDLHIDFQCEITM